MSGLSKHIIHEGGRKTVCVSHCLAFFGINPNQYNYTSSNKNREAYVDVLRRFGFGVRSRVSEFKCKKNGTTNLGDLQLTIKRNKAYNWSHYFIVLCHQQKAAHLIVVNGDGKVVVDTARGKRWKIENVKQVLYS